MSMIINGAEVRIQEGWSVLDAARFMGINIPTLCNHEGLSPWGGCRLCVVEVGQGPRTKLMSACTFPAQDGLVVRTHSRRVVRTRQMLVELLLASCPTSKTIQDLASELGVQRVRFRVRHDDCIYCGLCVRVCAEQMGARAIDFVNKGNALKVGTPFDRTSEVCLKCGACMYICPVCQLRCPGPSGDAVCGSCQILQPSCLESYEDYMCYMGAALECGTCVAMGKESKGGASR